MESQLAAIDGNKTHRIRTDHPTIERRAASYPLELREPFTWLSAFYASECQRDSDILVNRMAEVGITSISKIDWQRVLKGQLFVEENGRRRDEPVVDVDDLIAAIGKLRAAENAIEQGHMPYILTTVGQSIIDLVNVVMTPRMITRFGLIAGATGTEKTATLEHIVVTHPFRKFTLINASDNGGRGQLITDLAEQYGCSRACSVEQKTTTIRKSLNRDRAFIVENLQWLYRQARGDQHDAFNFIQKLQEETGCGVIGTFTAYFHKTILDELRGGFFEQFIGRAGGEKRILTLPRITPDEDLLTIAQAYKLRDSQKHLKLLQEISRENGLIRVLFDVLQRGKIAADNDGHEFTVEHIHAVRN